MTLRIAALASVLALSSPFAYAGAAPTDPQIAGIVVAANQVDIDAGKFAVGKASSADIKKLAQQMVTDHSAVNEQAKGLVTKLKVTPESSDTSASLKAGGEKNL